jgi:O-methyltransferase domain/Dimerisation domain
MAESQGDVPADVEVMAGVRQLIMGFRTTQLIYAAARLELADLAAGNPRTAPELAQATGADQGALHRLLRALASIGLFSEREDGRFALTAAGAWLRRDKPGSLRSTAMLYGDHVLWTAYGRLFEAVQSGQAAFDQVYGQSFYDYLSEHRTAGVLFQEAMTGFSEQEAQAIVAAYDFSACGRIVDVGGGQGALMAAVLSKNPKPHAVIFDQSPPAEETKRAFSIAGIEGRAAFVQGSFFETVPEGGDLYLLKSIIHNWDDQPALAILGKCRAAMPQQAFLLIAERLVPPGNGPSEAKLFDINMLVTLGGKERSEAEYAALLVSAGLSLTRVIPTRSHISLVEARRI